METSCTPGTARRKSARFSRLRSWPALTPSPAAWGTPGQHQELQRFAAAAQAAQAAGLGVNAGHDLSRENLSDFLRAVPGVQEVSIGHALISDALELGYAATVREYLAAIARASR